MAEVTITPGRSFGSSSAARRIPLRGFTGGLGDTPCHGGLTGWRHGPQSGLQQNNESIPQSAIRSLFSAQGLVTGNDIEQFLRNAHLPTTVIGVIQLVEAFRDVAFGVLHRR